MESQPLNRVFGQDYLSVESKYLIYWIIFNSHILCGTALKVSCANRSMEVRFESDAPTIIDMIYSIINNPHLMYSLF